MWKRGSSLNCSYISSAIRRNYFGSKKKDLVGVVQDFEIFTSQSEGLDKDLWGQFVQKIEGLSDPLLASIFKQAEFKEFDKQDSKLIVDFSKDVSFFGEWLKETESVWMGFLKSVFGDTIEFAPEFKVSKKSDTVSIAVKVEEAPRTIVKPLVISNKIVSPIAQRRATIINVSDKEKWKTANQLLEAFGGTIVEVQESEKAE